MWFKEKEANVKREYDEIITNVNSVLKKYKFENIHANHVHYDTNTNEIKIRKAPEKCKIKFTKLKTISTSNSLGKELIKELTQANIKYINLLDFICHKFEIMRWDLIMDENQYIFENSSGKLCLKIESPTLKMKDLFDEISEDEFNNIIKSNKEKIDG